ncbi:MULTISPECIES: hypothetical protein [Fusobacterium]|nr:MULTISPECIES: hypothetical protein [Fusobacterium]
MEILFLRVIELLDLAKEAIISKEYFCQDFLRGLQGRELGVF